MTRSDTDDFEESKVHDQVVDPSATGATLSTVKKVTFTDASKETAINQLPGESKARRKARKSAIKHKSAAIDSNIKVKQERDPKTH